MLCQLLGTTVGSKAALQTQQHRRLQEILIYLVEVLPRELRSGCTDRASMIYLVSQLISLSAVMENAALMQSCST